MNDADKNNKQLLTELAELRRQLQLAQSALRREGGAVHLEVLNRLRQQVWKMQGPQDIEQLLVTLRLGLEQLEVPFYKCGINVFDESGETLVMRSHNMDQQGQWQTAQISNPESAGAHLWRQKEVVYREDLEREDPYGERDGLSRAYGAAIRSVLDVPFAYGTLALNSTEAHAFSPQHIDMLRELADTLSEGFRRAEDLQALQERNRQLERELETRVAREKRGNARFRVREQVWKMRRAEDIAAVLEIVGENLRILEVPFDFCGVNIVVAKSSENLAQVYAMNQQGEWTRSGVADSPVVVRIWQSEKLTYRRDIRHEDPFDESLQFKTIRSLVDVPFSHGTLSVSSRTPNAFAPEHIEVLQHMAPLLEEGFQRMDDLQTLAARNVELEREIAERHRTEKQLYQAKEEAETANRAKSTFLANISHELRTPLNAILGFSQLLYRSDEVGEGQRKNLQTIRRSGEHLLALINDVLEMSRIEAGRTALEENAFALREMLDGLADIFRLRAQGKGLQLLCEYGDDVPPYVRADEGKLRQIFSNLLSNAVKFTEKGGVSFRARYSDGQVCFEVEDTGMGIAPVDQSQLFDAFVQTQSGRQSQTGTGLGLAISQQFAKMMGGEISLFSQMGKGSVFRFEIPIELAQAREVAPLARPRRAVALAPGQPEYRILVVEDNEDSRQLLHQLLESVGFQVREAVDGQQGVEMWEQWRPHLIWMDIRMPVLDGYEATRRIKALPGGDDTKILALTASAFAEDRRKVLDAGCDDFVRKPFQEAEFFDKMVEHLGLSFVYEEEQALEEVEPMDVDWSVLPSEYLEAVGRAAEVADSEKLEKITEQIRAEHPEVAEALAQLVYNFSFDQIVALVKGARA